MNEFISISVNLGVPLLIIVVALIAGTIIEKRHFRSIDRREKEYGDIPVLTGKKYPDGTSVVRAELVTGAVVISYDHFKRFLAGLRQIFGGEITAYTSLLDRARREAILRLKENCRNADLVINLRIETSSISKGKRKTIGCVEVFAFATALYFAGTPEK